ncbi:hypothetical protein pipiens_020095, partial [Culex pipiens pipiens]
ESINVRGRHCFFPPVQSGAEDLIFRLPKN